MVNVKNTHDVNHKIAEMVGEERCTYVYIHAHIHIWVISCHCVSNWPTCSFTEGKKPSGAMSVTVIACPHGSILYGSCLGALVVLIRS